jgi:hypothetical protein
MGYNIECLIKNDRGFLDAQKARRLVTRFEHGVSGVTSAFRCVDDIARMCA